MSLTASNMLPLGTQAPKFDLPDTLDNKNKTLDTLRGEKGTLVIFMCNHCPYVVYLLDAIVHFAKEINPKGIKTVAISSNNVNTHPQDGPDEMHELAIHKEFGFPYLFDESQLVAQAYQAACTPDFYLFDHLDTLYYRGRFDASRPNNDVSISGEDLRLATQLLLEGKPFTETQYPSMGCNIKWKPGNEPRGEFI